MLGGRIGYPQIILSGTDLSGGENNYKKGMPMTIKIDSVQYSRRESISKFLMRTQYCISRISLNNQKNPPGGGGYLLYKNVQNVLGVLLKTILRIRNSRFYENFYSKNCRMLPAFDKLFEYFWEKEKY